MASIIDSFREVFTDNLSFLKLIVLAVPVYFSYQAYLQSNQDFTNFFWVAGITAFFLFGFLIEVTNNVLSERNMVLPTLNPFNLAFVSFKGILAIVPMVIIFCLLANYICFLIHIVPWLDIVLESIIWIVTVSIIVTTFLLFCTNKRIFDAYNIKLIFQKLSDVIITLLFFVLQLIIANIPTSLFLGYTLLILFGYGPIFNSFLSLVLVFNIAVIGHYMAQVHYEILTYYGNAK